jgi:ribosome-binding protein aMBF1 (putative translation factor)
MGNKPFKRVYRTRKLTAAEVARDEEIRRKVEAEFPPLEAEGAAPLLSEPLKKAIEQSSKSVRQLAKEANVSSIVLAQFLAGRRDLRLATAEKLAHVLGLKLVSS